MMGSVIASDLARSADVDEVVVADIDQDRLKRVKRLGGRKLSTESVDVKNGARLARFLKGFDVVSSALTHGSVHPSDVVAVKNGAKLVNIAFEDEQMQLDAEAKKRGALLVPGCGVAPGLGGVLLARGAQELGGATEGHIMVGGLPQKPIPPFRYRLVFSMVGLLREYTDVARIVRGGKVVKVRPFDEITTVEFPAPIGKCEGFFTDGLGSLLYTMKGFRELDEMTLRWPGHGGMMKVLVDGGFLSKDKVSVDGVEISPFDLTAAVLSGQFSRGGPEDVTVMRVVVRGSAGQITYDLVDYYDKNLGVTSMGKTTGYTCSIVTQMVGRGEVKGRGVLPPETALDGRSIERLTSELGKRDVRISARRA
jgi:lysine 6-dehydrogenase